MKVGDLVTYVPEPSALFKWERYRGLGQRRPPGIIVEAIEHSYSHTPRFKIRWHTGIITEEWASYLKIYEDMED
jgi:hypothetical protein|tara:strand:- start:459 stop:680 length:222 start_codon:yes stop_codon:yes gene_type:complete